MKTFHMSAAQFREEGKKLVDWIADYYEQVEKYPVLAQVNPGDIMRQLPDEAPEEGVVVRSNDARCRSNYYAGHNPLAITRVF